MYITQLNLGNTIRFCPHSKADPCRFALVGSLDLHLCHHRGGKVAGWKPAQFPGCNQPWMFVGFGVVDVCRNTCSFAHAQIHVQIYLF